MWLSAEAWSAKMSGLQKMKPLGAPKMTMPRPRKMPKLRPHMAFGAGAAMHQAFHDPAMTAPDQAFSTAMAMPQGVGAAAPEPAMPAPATPAAE
jgi:hypothetical protein